jgi:hypothetical protein
MAERKHDPSVFSEPHLRPPSAPQPTGSFIPYAQPDTPIPRDIDPKQDIRNEPIAFAPATAEHSVWDEPGLTPTLAGRPSAHDVTYATWLDQNRARWGLGKSWALTLGLALVAGPFAIVGAFWNSGATIFSILMMVVIGPVTEEIMKVAAPTLVVEKLPFAFRSSVQIVLCAFAGALAFAAIENLLYIYVYVKNPTPSFIAFRWTVLVALHTGCSLIASIGIARVWRDVWQRRAAPRLSLAFPFLVTAIVIHGGYNGTVLILSTLGWEP